MCPPGWKLIYWTGTLVTSAHQVSRLLPLVLLAFLVWQVFAFAHRRAGTVVAALTVFLVLHCPFVWDRMVGANPRAFGMPLVIAFLRYASEKRRGATALVLVAQAAFYPSVLLVCAPAWAVLMLVEAVQQRRKEPLRWLLIGGLACGALVLPALVHGDPRIGPPITMEQLAHLKQRSIWSLYPLIPHRWVFGRAIFIPLLDDLPAPLAGAAVARVLDLLTVILAALAFGIGLLRRRVPLAFGCVLACSVAAYALACAVAYRLYVPDRLVHYSWTPVILLLFGELVVELFGSPANDRPPREGRRPRLLVATGLVALIVVANGTGVTSYSGLRDWEARRNATLSFLETLPRDVLIAAHPSISSDVEMFAKRSVLFSGITNAPNFATYGLTVENRIGRFYDAYYAADLESVRRFAREERVDYLLVDERDFGAEAALRARYVSPWTERAEALLRRTPAAHMALAKPPAAAITHRDDHLLVIDTKKL